MADPFCASSPEAAAMTDAEFWAHVYPDVEEPIDPYAGEPGPADLIVDPCPVCGVRGICHWDVDGNPMIHIVEADDD